MFVRIMLKDEQDWYIQECLEIPTIPFLDNSPILGKIYNQKKLDNRNEITRPRIK